VPYSRRRRASSRSGRRRYGCARDPYDPGHCRLARDRAGRVGRLLRDVLQWKPRLRHSLPGDVPAIGHRRRRHLRAGFHRPHSAELRAAHARRLHFDTAGANAGRPGAGGTLEARHDVAMHVAVGRHLCAELSSLRWLEDDAERRASMPYSITSSASASTVAGTVRPSALAVLRFRTNSNTATCTTGRSRGCSPFKIRAT